MVAAHLPEAALQDLRKVAFRGAVVQLGRWLHRFETEVHGRAVALLRSYHCTRTIEREALFVVTGDDLVELFPAYGEPPAGRSREELIHRDPTTGPEIQPKLLRTMAQVLAQVFAQEQAPPVFAPTHGTDANTRGLVFRTLLDNDGMI